MKTFSPDYPIILGLAGKAGTGKTTTAHILAPQTRGGTVFAERDGGPKSASPRIYWDHIYFAMPIYQILAARKKIQGFNKYERMKYEIHNTLLEVFGSNPLYGAPDYDVLVGLVNSFTHMRFNEDEEKPRAFLQEVADSCLDIDPDCFTKWAGRKSSQLFWSYMNAIPEEERQPFGVIISDVRFPNNAQLIKDHPNGVLIHLTTREDVRYDRIVDRDGVLNRERLEHVSEKALDEFDESYYDLTIDTTDMTPQEQALTIFNYFEGALHA